MGYLVLNGLYLGASRSQIWASALGYWGKVVTWSGQVEKVKHKFPLVLYSKVNIYDLFILRASKSFLCRASFLSGQVFFNQLTSYMHLPKWAIKCCKILCTALVSNPKPCCIKATCMFDIISNANILIKQKTTN